MTASPPSAQGIFQHGELEYCDLIAELGRANASSPLWWASSLSSKNFGTSLLWQRLQRFLADGTVHQPQGSCVRLADVALHRLYRLRLTAPGRLRRAFRRRRNEFAACNLLLMSHFDRRSFAGGDGDYRDWIWQRLIEYAAGQGKRVAVVALTPADERFVREQLLLRANRPDAFPVLPIELFQEPQDVAWALGQCLTGADLKLPETVVFQGRDIAPVLRAQWQEERWNGELLYNLMYAPAYRRVLRMTQAPRILWPWENHCWERFLMLARETTGSTARLIGYQHSTIPPSLINHFPGRAELEYAPYPDRILCTGERPAAMLAAYGHFPPACLEPACAVRYDSLWEQVKEPHPRRGPLESIGVALSCEREVCQAMMELLRGALWDAGCPRVLLKPHPLLADNRLQAIVGELPAHVSIVTGSLGEFCAEIDCLLYAKTTVGFEAVCMGLPVVSLGYPGGAADDPLFELETFRWTADAPDELRSVLEAIGAMDDSSRRAGHRAAVAYIRSYLRPVSAEGLQRLLAAE